MAGGASAPALAPHPHLQLWLNQVERCISIITGKAIPPRMFALVKDLVARIDHFVARYNQDCKPFAWTATADPILAKTCKRISPKGHRAE